MTDLTQALAVGRDDTRRFSVALIDLEKAYNNALAADVDVVSAMWMNLSMDCAKVSNDLIPRADADLAVALMVERAADIVGMCDQVGADAEGPVRTLTPASALSELQELRDSDAESKGNLAHALHQFGQAKAELAPLRAQVERLTGALTIAANRLHRCSVDYDTGTREFIEVGGWADEARAALTEGAALEAHEKTLPTDQG